MPPKAKKKRPKQKEQEQEEKTDADVEEEVPLIEEEGVASIVFSPARHLMDILSFVNLNDVGKTVSLTNKHWDTAATSMLEMWDSAVTSCYPQMRPPRWHRNPAQPRLVAQDLRRSALSRGLDEEKKQCVELALTPSVASSVESWKQDVIQASEEVGVANYCRWDLIDAVQDPEAIRYSFQFYGDDVYFTAYNEAASRLGVTSCYFKTWIRREPLSTYKKMAADGDTEDTEGKGEGKTEGKEIELVASTKVEEGETKEGMIVVAVVDADRYNDYVKWRRRGDGDRKGGESGGVKGTTKRTLMPSNSYNGSVVFEVLPSVGPSGRAAVDYHRS